MPATTAKAVTQTVAPVKKPAYSALTKIEADPELASGLKVADALKILGTERANRSAMQQRYLNILAQVKNRFGEEIGKVKTQLEADEKARQAKIEAMRKELDTEATALQQVRSSLAELGAPVRATGTGHRAQRSNVTDEQIRQYKEQNPDSTQAEIREHFGVSNGKVWVALHPEYKANRAKA